MLDLCIFHVDMDAYFASIEQRDNEYLKGVPVIVSGHVNRRSVVSTCSYEAREYGIRSSMPTKTAYNLCPNGVFIFPRIEYYKSISRKIKDILMEFTDSVEMFSLDEAYLDVSKNKVNVYDSFELAVMIQKRIFSDLNLTCSIGVSFTKFFAKIASDYKKPNGITVIDRDNYRDIVDVLDIRKIYGIGASTYLKLSKIGVRYGRDLKMLSKDFLYNKFGVRGIRLFDNIRGVDDSKIVTRRVQKSFGKEVTFDKDLDIDNVLGLVKNFAVYICDLMVRRKMYCRTLSVKIKFFDFTCITRQVTRDMIFEYSDVFFILNSLLRYNVLGDKKIRLIGVQISNVVKFGDVGKQLSLF